MRGAPGRASQLYGQAYDLSMDAGDYLDAAWDAASASVALAYANQLKEAGRLARKAHDAAAASGAPSSLALSSWAMGEITADTDPAQARQHLQRAVDLATPVGSLLVVALAEVSLATLHARHGDPRLRSATISASSRNGGELALGHRSGSLSAPSSTC